MYLWVIIGYIWSKATFTQKCFLLKTVTFFFVYAPSVYTKMVKTLLKTFSFENVIQSENIRKRDEQNG